MNFLITIKNLAFYATSLARKKDILPMLDLLILNFALSGFHAVLVCAIFINLELDGVISLFNDISTFIGYLMPKSS